MYSHGDNSVEMSELLYEYERNEELLNSSIFKNFVCDDEDENEHEEYIEDVNILSEDSEFCSTNKKSQMELIEGSFNNQSDFIVHTQILIHLFYNTEDSEEEEDELPIGEMSTDNVGSICSLMNFDIEKGLSVPCTRSSYRSLKQCVGVWEMNPEIVSMMDKGPETLGVCDPFSHRSKF